MIRPRPPRNKLERNFRLTLWAITVVIAIAAVVVLLAAAFKFLQLLILWWSLR